MRARNKKKQIAKPSEPSPFFEKKKDSPAVKGTVPFFQSAPGLQRKANDTTASKRIQKQGGEKDAGRSIDAGTADAGSPPFDIKNIRNEFAATVFAEAWPGQESDIAWIYYNLVSQSKNESGLGKSSAYRGKSDNYKIALTALGDKRFGADKPTAGWLKESKAESIQDYVDHNDYFRTVAGPRINSIAGIVDGIINDPSKNPYVGWTGQGNLNDFNNISSPGSSYWKMARAYYWLQEAKKVKEVYVKPLGSGKTMQFIFNGGKIQEYYKSNPLPKDVPLYKEE